MAIEDKLIVRQIMEINQKLDYLINKTQYTEEALSALINIVLPAPPEYDEEDISDDKKLDELNNVSTKAVDSCAIKPCLYKYVYIWTDKGKSFWAWLAYVGKESISGWKWNGRRWVYFGIDLRHIDSFVCY